MTTATNCNHPLKCELSRAKRCQCWCMGYWHNVQTTLTPEEIRGEKLITVTRAINRTREIVEKAVNAVFRE